MKKILTVVFCALLLSSIGSAIGLNSCASYAAAGGGQGTEVNYITAQGGCTAGALTFMNFAYSGAIQGSSTSSTTGGDFFLDNATLSNGIWDIGFNPGPLFSPGTSEGDVHFQFIVTCGVLGADLRVTTTGTSITEDICQDPTVLSTGPSANCAGHTTLLWASPTVNGPGVAPAQGEFIFTQGSQAVIYAWKDLNAGSADLSQFDETFGVPEPVSFLMVGSAFVGLGILRFRRKKS